MTTSERTGSTASAAPSPGRPGAPPLRVLHLLAPCEAGGLERVVQALAIGHRRRGHEVHVAAVLAPGEDRHPFLEPLRAADLPFHPLHVHGRGYLRERRLLADLMRELAPDVLHTHGYRPNVVNSGLARREGIATVSTVHGFTGGDWKNRLYEWLERRALRRVDAVVPVSRPLAAQLQREGVASSRLHLLPNAWFEREPPLPRQAARAALQLPAERFHLGWVGRLGREKGLDLLLEALPQLADLPLALTVLGDGQERVALERRAAALGVAEQVHWRGTVAEAGRHFPAFDLFVLSSRTEGTPIVLFEAMAAAVPIVATRVGGVPDVLSEREALLVPPDEPAALAAAIRAVYQDAGAAAERAAAARRRLHRDFAPEPWLERYEALYRRLLTKRRTT